MFENVTSEMMENNDSTNMKAEIPSRIQDFFRNLKLGQEDKLENNMSIFRLNIFQIYCN